MGTVRPTFRPFVKLIIAVALTAALSVGIASVVHAGNFSKSYDLYWNFPTSALNVCIRYRVTGTYTYSAVALHGGGAEWSHIKLNDPKLTAYVYSHAGGCGSSSAKVSQLEMTQYWSGYGCSFNPSISLGAPFSVGIGFWPNCGNRNLAKYFSSYPSSGSNYKQYDSGSPGGFGEYISNSPQYPPCYGVYVSSTAWEHNTSDHFTAQSAQRVCLTV